MMLPVVIGWVVLPTLSVALALATWRLLVGPSLADRVVALDMIALVAIGMLAAFAVGVGQAVYLDLILGVALVAFLGTVAFAHYIERRGGDG